eukprot:8955187-Pyramimonas_sp.AAC.1
MWAPTPGPWVELPMGPQSAVLGTGDACGHRQWGLGWSSLWGYGALCWVDETHVDTATGALRGATRR